ncbi:hypothetical protein NADFUDRAFT_81661 [Nadsonia fulvescens var. elongata DSM 6958]|uniref:G-protein coupled receptors family 1 profile domain-containing protein n=1 Tax=Nadsonia fulvescens var. elongata DSM 6958 TaxID=857566 RepID=A0A1E3PNP6_9ASCO|nr:hypothetical protein NADFUDRAFT_81661 [Nadsonia fulvescens var. elongata DSM 6958]
MSCPVYVHHQMRTLQIVALSSSSLSIVSFVFICIWEFHVRKSHSIKFRHKLILGLIFSDFIKSICVFIYSVFVLHYGDTVIPMPFIASIGFIFAWAKTASDFSVFMLVIYTGLIIFKPNRVEILAEHQYYVLSFLLILPLIMAALAFANTNIYTSVGYRGYVPKIFYSYLPMVPIWPALLLAWIPRYIIMFTILVLYGAIYLYVKLEFHRLSRTMHSGAPIATQSHIDHQNDELQSDNVIPAKKSIWSWARICKKLKNSVSSMSYLPFIKPLPSVSATSSPENNPAQLWQNLANDINQANIEKFNNRRYMVERQMSFIFVYPIAYMFAWLGPLLQQAVQYNTLAKARDDTSASNFMVKCFETETKAETGRWNGGGIYWISVLTAVCIPLNCFVIAVIYLFKESGLIKSQRQNSHLINSKRPGFINSSDLDGITRSYQDDENTNHSRPHNKPRSLKAIKKLISFSKGAKHKKHHSVSTINPLDMLPLSGPSAYYLNTLQGELRSFENPVEFTSGAKSTSFTSEPFSSSISIPSKSKIFSQPYTELNSSSPCEKCEENHIFSSSTTILHNNYPGELQKITKEPSFETTYNEEDNSNYNSQMANLPCACDCHGEGNNYYIDDFEQTNDQNHSHEQVEEKYVFDLINFLNSKEP